MPGFAFVVLFLDKGAIHSSLNLQEPFWQAFCAGPYFQNDAFLLCALKDMLGAN